MSEWWTDERVGQLRTMWGEGKSATEIAIHFGTVSRNAVLGKVHRLKLAERDTVSKHTPKTRSPKIRLSGGFNKPRVVEKQKPQPKVSVEPLPVFPVGSALDLSRYRLDGVVPTRFSDVLERPGRCKWILQSMDEKADADAPCCGALTERGGELWKPYCTTHSRIAYTPAGAR